MFEKPTKQEQVSWCGVMARGQDSAKVRGRMRVVTKYWVGESQSKARAKMEEVAAVFDEKKLAKQSEVQNEPNDLPLRYSKRKVELDRQRWSSSWQYFQATTATVPRAAWTIRKVFMANFSHCKRDGKGCTLGNELSDREQHLVLRSHPCPQ